LSKEEMDDLRAIAAERRRQSISADLGGVRTSDDMVRAVDNVRSSVPGLSQTEAIQIAAIRNPELFGSVMQESGEPQGRRRVSPIHRRAGSAAPPNPANTKAELVAKLKDPKLSRAERGRVRRQLISVMHAQR
jgi:hypothetical protein